MFLHVMAQTKLLMHTNNLDGTNLLNERHHVLWWLLLNFQWIFNDDIVHVVTLF